MTPASGGVRSDSGDKTASANASGTQTRARSPGGESVGLEESARLAGGHCWSERRLFEILGGWVSSTPDPSVKLMLDRHSQNHAWRAAQWWERLPVLADVDRDALIEAPSPAVAAAMDELAGAQEMLARLSGAYRVGLPRLFGAYYRHRAAASPVSDGAVLRTLGLVASDLAADWGEGEVVLQAFVDDGQSALASAAAVARLEGLLAG